jgi:Transposase IS116/IS110/IS902 family
VAIFPSLSSKRTILSPHYDQQIETLAREHPDFAIIDSLPGVGPALAPRLIAALGTRRDRYQSAGELQSYSGIAPVLASSGKQCWVHWRWACPKFLRQTFHEWATHTIVSSAWAKAYYEQQRAKGKPRTHSPCMAARRADRETPGPASIFA